MRQSLVTSFFTDAVVVITAPAPPCNYVTSSAVVVVVVFFTLTDRASTIPNCNYVTSSAVSNHVEVRGGDCGYLGVLLAANRVFSLLPYQITPGWFLELSGHGSVGS